MSATDRGPDYTNLLRQSVALAKQKNRISGADRDATPEATALERDGSMIGAGTFTPHHPTSGPDVTLSQGVLKTLKVRARRNGSEPAYPIVEMYGLTKREHIAASILGHLVAISPDTAIPDAAEDAVELADALLLALAHKDQL